MPLLNPYCTVAQVQAEIRNAKEEIILQLEEAINQASRWIDGYTRRDFYQHDHTQAPLELDKSDLCIYAETLFLPYRPLISLSKVESAGIELALNVDYFIANDGNRLVSIGGVWPEGFRPVNSVKLTGMFGYSQAVDGVYSAANVPSGIPDFVTRAAIMVAAAFSGHNCKEVVGLDGAKQSVIDKNIPKVVYDILGSRPPLL